MCKQTIYLSTEKDINLPSLLQYNTVALSRQILDNKLIFGIENPIVCLHDDDDDDDDQQANKQTKTNSSWSWLSSNLNLA